MNPMIREALGSILRRVLGYGGTWLVARGVWSDEASALYVAGFAGMLLDLAWSQWKTYNSRRKLVTAQAMSGSVTERQVNAAVEAGQAPPVTLSDHETPKLKADWDAGKRKPLPPLFTPPSTKPRDDDYTGRR